MNEAEFKLYQALYDRRNKPVGPTIHDLIRITGINSKSTIWRRLESLENTGYIEIKRGGSGRRNEYYLTGKRPRGFGQVADGFMPKDVLGNWVLGAFSDEQCGSEYLPVTITIEERDIG